MIFVFSALHPDEWAQAVHNAYTVRAPSRAAESSFTGSSSPREIGQC